MKTQHITRWYKEAFGGWVELPAPLPLTSLVIRCAMALGYTHLEVYRNGKISSHEPAELLL